MIPLDEGRPFVSLSIAVICVSDTRTLDTDRSGQVIAEKLVQAGHRLAGRMVVKDERPALEAELRRCIQALDIEVAIATGGTGITGRDITPEALRAVCDKEIPGFGELFRMLSYTKIGTSTIQSRACAGVAGGTYLFAVPGSPSACRDAWDWILGPQLDARTRPCNFAELLPRLRER